MYSRTTTRYGEYAYPKQDDPIGRSLDLYGEWAEDEVQLLTSLLRPGDTVLDVGANIGTHTVPFSRAVGDSGRVVAIEPQPEIFKLLEENVGRNALPNVTFHNAALSHAKGSAWFPRLDYSRHFNFGAVSAVAPSTMRHEDMVEIPSINLDALGVERCDLLKLDAEGAEMNILAGGPRMLETLRPFVYLECNAISPGAAAIEHLKARGYRCFYVETAAFNAANFKATALNVFGHAHESSLLFAPEEKLPLVDRIGRQLTPIATRAELVESFVRTLRHGDVPGRHTHAYRNLARRGQHASLHLDGRFLRPVVVVVPVYNAPAMLRGLLASLATAVPEPLAGLSFYFADDCSPDPEVQRILHGEFCRRPDVRVCRNIENLGFIGNVNAALRAADPEADVVLINSDTEVWDEIFSVMQAEAYSDPSIATITPLTNNGTIASLFDFPEGSKVPRGVTAAQLSRAASNLALPLADIPAPTGVGFCMYMKREAIDAAGHFDPAYGRGYGEECDWSRRTHAMGWKHLISCKAFVSHVGTQSFESEFKRMSVQANSRLLLSRFPEYDNDVAAYVARDPLKFERILVLLTALRERAHSAQRSVYLMTLHADPDGGGGTERHVRLLRDELCSRGHAVLELFPNDEGMFSLRGHVAEGPIFVERVHSSAVPHLLQLVERFVSCLHVHHTLRWPTEAVSALKDVRIPLKLISAHDYYLVCPRIHLLRAPDERSYCGVEADLTACNACLRQRPNQQNESIQLYRARRLELLAAFDALVFPSETMVENFQRAFGDGWQRLAHRTVILPHDLAHLHAFAADRGVPAPARPEKKIVFIGGTGPHKGSYAIYEAIPHLRALGFEVEFFGGVYPPLPEHLGHVPITPFQGAEQLRALLRRSNPSVAAFPSVAAESFCYTFFEALFLSDTAVPVVSPYGNPAAVVRREGFGIVMKDTSAAALVSACVEADSRWEELLGGRNAYLRTLMGAEPYYERYLRIEAEVIRLPSEVLAPRPAPDLRLISSLDATARAAAGQNLQRLLAEQDRREQESNAVRSERDALLADRDALLAERETSALKAALIIQRQLREYPRAKNALLSSARLGWRALKQVRSFVRR